MSCPGEAAAQPTGLALIKHLSTAKYNRPQIFSIMGPKHWFVGMSVVVLNIYGQVFSL